MAPGALNEEGEFEALLAALRDGILVVTFEGDVVYVNPAACALLGRLESEIIGLPFGFPIAGKGDVDITILRPGGVPRILEMRSNPIEWHREQVLLVALRDVTEQRRMAEELQRLARRDGLTGAYNHLTFYSMLKDEVARTKRNKRELSLLILDIDFFKKVNDDCGHQGGDMVLVEIARRICDEVREIDRVCRYGGEEFAVILPDTGIQGAVVVGERIRERFHNEPCSTSKERSVSVTVSLGAASLPGHASNADELVEQADTALYRAKDLGRNRLIAAGEPVRDDRDGRS